MPPLIVPPPTARSRVQGFVAWSTALSRRDALTATVSAFAAMTLADWLAGAGVSLGLFALLLTMFGAWTLGRTAGYMLAAIITVTTGVINGLHPADVAGALSLGSSVWNTGSSLLALAIIAAIASGWRAALDAERWLACTDALTGALNKPGFQAAMPGRVADAAQRDAALILLYMDLDGFKSVNDHFGHAAGDAVLRAFATGAAASLRAGDLFARIGGDEFVALLSVPRADDGDQVAEVLHDRLGACLAATGHPVTCSTGAVVMKAGQAPASGQAFLELADKLMYEVKRAGKNGLRVARADLTGMVLRPACWSPADDSRSAALPVDPGEANARELKVAA